MKSFILFTVSVLLGLLLVPFNNNNNGVAVCALDAKRILHQTMPASSQGHQQQHEKHEHHEQHTRHSKKAPGWEKALKKDSKSKSESKSTESTSKSVKSKSVKSKSTKSKSTTVAPTNTPTNAPTNTPTHKPSDSPTHVPTNAPTHAPTNEPTDAPTKEERSIAEIICDPDNADIFGRLCEALGITDILRELDDQRDGPYTLFAPNNSALLNVKFFQGTMQQILLTHVLAGEVSTNELICDGRYNMVNGQPTTTKCGDSNEQKFQIGDDNQFSYPQIVPANSNIQATNGIIHEIDGVIFPIIPR